MYEIVTTEGVETKPTLQEAKEFARYVAKATGRAVTVRPSPKHDDPCVCSVYDRCNAQRLQDYRRSGNWRDLFRAYND